MQSAKAINQHLKKAKKIIIVPHQNPDGDALGSATALYEYLKNLNKEVEIFCATEVTDKLHFLPKVIINPDPNIFQDPKVDTVITVDSGDLRYAGIAEYVKDKNLTIVNIDHHATNESFGHLNLVISTAASTTEILYQFFRFNGIHINNKMATALLTGLTTDTGNFSNSATSSNALAAGGDLMLSGGNMNVITNNVLKNASVESLKLWGKAFSRLQKDERLNLTYTFLTRADLLELGVKDEEAQGISNFLSNLDNTSMTLLLMETEDGRVKGSFRTTRHDVDVAAYAKTLGGGGHKKAAGFTSEGKIEEVLQKVLTLKK